jgi:hypothetical protein
MPLRVYADNTDFPKKLFVFHNFIQPSEYDIYVKIHETAQLTIFHVF